MKTDDFKFLVEYAVKALSGHNTQPWKFESTEDGVVTLIAKALFAIIHFSGSESLSTIFRFTTR
ncbi:MAG: hypothetical protein P1P86_04000 [Bacteroidales bacterium]|nr:hypothetical protein [Bacteroidales bacterium]